MAKFGFFGPRKGQTWQLWRQEQRFPAILLWKSAWARPRPARRPRVCWWRPTWPRRPPACPPLFRRPSTRLSSSLCPGTAPSTAAVSCWCGTRRCSAWSWAACGRVSQRSRAEREEAGCVGVRKEGFGHLLSAKKIVPPPRRFSMLLPTVGRQSKVKSRLGLIPRQVVAAPKKSI